MIAILTGVKWNLNMVLICISFPDDKILFLKDSEYSTKKFLDIINSFSKGAGWKITLQKSVTVLYTNNEQNEKEYRKAISFTIASKQQHT
jgi:hypothetical protein